MKIRESISITIPAFNEEETIELVVKDALVAVKKLTSNFEIVLVNDGSTDKTGKIIDRLAKKNKKIRAIHHKKNKGFTGAMKTSVYSAKKEFVFLAPADGQFDFRELVRFREAIKGHDGAIGYRETRDENLVRKFNSWAFHFLVKMIFNLPFKEISSVFMWRRQVIKSIDIISEDRSAMFLPEFFYKAVLKKYKFAQVPVHWHPRAGGETKGASPIVMVKTVWGMVKLRLKMEQHK